MKKLGLLVLTGVMVLALNANVFAIPAFKKTWDAHYLEGNENADFVAAAEEAKCNVCHYGKSKKNRTDYGKALHKFLEKDDYKSSRVKEEPEKVKAEILEAFKKVEEMKAEDGKTFGEKIKAGTLPGTIPADAEEE
jgi:formylmethanofuran dehydrogenase subunit E